MLGITHVYARDYLKLRLRLRLCHRAGDTIVGGDTIEGDTIDGGEYL